LIDGSFVRTANSAVLRRLRVTGTKNTSAVPPLRKTTQRTQLVVRSATSTGETNIPDYVFANDVLVKGLKDVYLSKIKPVETLFKFDAVYGPCLSEADFDSVPNVLLLGQYSTGKTTFIKSLLKGKEYPGSHIGPEPTTDKFVIVMGGDEDRRIPGNTLVVQKDKPFTDLTRFGSDFLNKLECTECDSPLLREVTLIDTPGVLSGEKQRSDRSYEFDKVCQWFADRSDVILLLFDPAKLDISDEFKEVISSLKGNEDKVRIVLNKADQVNMQQLMRVYGALMWSLRNAFDKPEVPRVYVGSFNTEPYRKDINSDGEHLFLREHEDLVKDLYEIPRRSADRKVNEFVKRVRAARTHALIISHLKRSMPNVFGKEKAKENLLVNLEDEFYKVRVEHRLAAGDFPPVSEFRDAIRSLDFSKFPELNKRQLDTFDNVLSQDLPALLMRCDNGGGYYGKLLKSDKFSESPPGQKKRGGVQGFFQNDKF